MKPLVISAALLGMALGGHAQQPPAAAGPPPAIDGSRYDRVPSPNRTLSRAWADPEKSMKHRQRNKADKADKDMPSGAAAITWVDSAGKTIGRAIGSNAMLVPYDNQWATLTGLDTDQRCDAGVCVYPSGGNQWSPYFSVYYLTADCTGLPYLPYRGLGTPYVGVPVTDEGSTYLYIAQVTQTTRVNVNSSFTNNACLAIRGGSLPLDAAPVATVLPASAFGTPPYFLR